MKNKELRAAAMELYIIKGKSLNEILATQNGLVSKRTLSNWKKSDKWEKKRKNIINRKLIMKDRLFLLLKKVIKIATENPTKDNLDNLQHVKMIYDEEIILDSVDLASLDKEILLSLKELARVISPNDSEKAYSKIRKRASRGFYITQRILKGKIFLNVNDPGISISDRRKILSLKLKSDKGA